MDTQTTTPTTSAAPPPAAAVSTPTTGATTTPTSGSVTPAERPKTMAEAFARDAASQTAPSTETGTATTQPAEGTETPSATNPSTEQGPIPFPVHKTALDNARTKAVDEFRQTAGVDKAIAFADRITANPTGFLGEYLSEMLANPQHAQATKAVLARMFGGLRQPAAPKPAAAEPMPGPDVQIVDANGQVTGMTYSADQLDRRDQWREKQSAEKSAKAERDRETAKATAAATAKHVETRSNEVLAEISDTLELDATTPADQRNALFSAVNKLMAANPNMSAHRAALQVRKTHIVPAQAGKAQADVLETLKTKAAAQAVNPAGAVVAATSRPRSFLDKSLKW